jgi:hypothetical protein
MNLKFQVEPDKLEIEYKKPKIKTVNAKIV